MSKTKYARERGRGENWNYNKNTAVAHNENYVLQETNIAISFGEEIRGKVDRKMKSKFGNRGGE